MTMVGVQPEEELPEPEPGADRDIAARVEEHLLGGPRRFRRNQVAAVSGVDLIYVRRLWRAMGFANVGDDAVAFTEGDLLALDNLLHLIQDEVVDTEFAVSITRAMGHTMARLVQWQVEALTEYLSQSRGLTGREAVAAGITVAGEHLDDFERLLVYVWRRQLAAVAGRALGSPTEADTGWLAVGFADLVSYTRLSQRLEERALAVLVDRFETRASDAVAACSGRLVKTVGDEVLFVADSAERAIEIGLTLAETMAADDLLPDVRVGIASGAVISRMGDVFGRTVNLASRLTSMAEPGGVLLDEATARAVESLPTLRIDYTRTRAVRGLGLVRAAVVRRSDHGLGEVRNRARDDRP
jgi:adenylate cyclase